MHVLAAAPQVLNVAAIKTLLVSLLGIVVIIVAIGLAIRAHARNFGAVVGGLAIVVIALLVFAMASGNHYQSVANALYNLIIKV
jgi:uncharacterized membrane protein YkgB